MNSPISPSFKNVSTTTSRCQSCGIRGVCENFNASDCLDFCPELTEFADPVLRKRLQNPATRNRKPGQFVLRRFK